MTGLPPETFNARLRFLRMRSRFSLGQLALRSGISKATLSRWESGKSIPRIPELLLVLEALGASTQERNQCLRLLDVPRALLTERDDLELTPRLSLGDHLFGLRQRIGKTQEEVARAASVSRSLYRQWESDQVRPTGSQLHVIGFALSASGEEIAYLTTASFTHYPVENSREALLRKYQETMEWQMEPVAYKLFLFSLLANVAGLVRRGKADIGDIALLVVKYGLCANLWYGSEALKERYAKQALNLAKRSSEPLHFHLLTTVADTPETAFSWERRFPGNTSRAYLLSLVAMSIAPENPDEALRLGELSCNLVADDPDESPCRLRDYGTLLRLCGRYSESVDYIANLEPPDTYRAGLNQINMARALIKLDATAEARNCLEVGKSILRPWNLQLLENIFAELEHLL